jgi:hypothetical protein
MTIHISLYEGEHICLGPIDHEKDAEVEARWTQDADYMKAVDFLPAHPLSVAQLKKKYEAIEKQMEEDKNFFYFTIRLRSTDPEQNDRLVGFARIEWIEWTHGNGNLRLAIGDPADRRKGYGREALNLLLRFAFGELNLYRLSASIAEYNAPALALFKQAGFVEEVRRRQALNRDGRTWDVIHAGLLQAEWRESVISEQ